jgi:hypothetical protein
VRAELGPDGSEVTRLRGSVPDTAAEAEVRIAVGPATQLAFASATLDMRSPTIIPVSFLAEAPGSLTVRDFTIGFREAPAPVPQPPPEGPCLPTPADSAPGDVCDCDPCGEHAAPAETAFAIARRPMPTRPVTATAWLAATGTRRLVAARLRDLPDAALVAVDRPLEVARAVTDVDDIGQVRAAALAGIGVTTARHLALADPWMLARRLGFHRSLAELVVRNARDTVAARERGEADPDGGA